MLVSGGGRMEWDELGMCLETMGIQRFNLKMEKRRVLSFGLFSELGVTR